jgi:hypothetical protein
MGHGRKKGQRKHTNPESDDDFLHLNLFRDFVVVISARLPG